MKFQITNRTTGEIKGFDNPYTLKAEILNLTDNNVYEAESVFEWATTPAAGSFKYNSEKFDILIIGQN